MTITIQRLSAEELRARKDEFVELLRDVVDGGSSVNFLAPLDRTLAAAFWERIAGEAAAGQRVVLAVEDEARAANRSLLVLDTEKDSGAEKRYERAGYIRVGVISQFGLESTGNHWIDAVFFYKLLA